MIETGIQLFGFDIGTLIESFLAVIGAIVIIGKTVAKFTPTTKDDEFFDKVGSMLPKKVDEDKEVK